MLLVRRRRETRGGPGWCGEAVSCEERLWRALWSAAHTHCVLWAKKLVCLRMLVCLIR